MEAEMIVNMTESNPLCLTTLPDELIAMCYSSLPASDLVTLEHVSSRLRSLVSSDSICWKRCTMNRWQRLGSNAKILPAAATHAGGWKPLYAEKALSDTKHAPWLIVTPSETRAIIDVVAGLKDKTTAPRPIKQDMTPSWSHAVTPCTPPAQFSTMASMAASPVSVISAPSEPASGGALSVVLLIDASSSVTDEDFSCMKNFSNTLVDTLRGENVEASVGIIQFNQHPRLEVGLTPVEKPKLKASIQAMDQLMGSTDIAAPIRRAREMLADEAAPGDRVIVLLTDGQTHADELCESEREARQAAELVQARVYTLGVGRDIDEAGLARVAGGSPDGQHFTLRRYNHSK